MLKTKLSFHDWSDWVCSIIKTRKNNNVNDHKDMIYVENDIEVLWSIELGANLMKPNRTTTWLIIQMWSTLKTKLSYYDQLNRVRYVTKTKEDNNMTDRICLV